MDIINLLCVALWLFTLPSSSLGVPTTNIAKRGAFSMPVTKNADSLRDGPMEVYRTYRKFGIDIPTRLQEIVQSRLSMKVALDDDDEDDEGSAPAVSRDGDLLWLTPIGVGTPPQTLPVDIDTGSSDTWLFSTDTAQANIEGQTIYDPSQSSTSELIHNCTWSILYGDYSTSEGICYKDTLTIGDLSIPDMVIESAKKTSKMFTETKGFSGLLGLGFSSLGQTEPKQKTLMDYLPGALQEPIFTADLKHNETGSFNFGYIDDSLYDESVEYVKVNTSDGFWSVLHKSFAMSGDNLQWEFHKPREVIVDTGSTLLFVPEAAADTYYESAGGRYSSKEYGYVLPCDKTPPDFTMVIADEDGNTAETTIPGAYVVYAKVNDTSCYGGIQTMSGFTGLEGILGDIYLKSGFAVFDIGKEQFGMAPKPLNASLEGHDGGGKRAETNIVKFI